MVIDNIHGEYIHGDKFIVLADFIIKENVKQYCDKLFNNNSCVFCHTQFVSEFFKYISGSSKKYILISHNSDDNVDEILYAQKPPNVSRWYAQNVIAKHNDLIPIPIGIERPYCGLSWDMQVLKREASRIFT